MPVSESKARILLADDNPSDRIILESFVHHLGYEVFSASDGVEAIDLYHKITPDIILLDALMPRMDGFEVARYIKKSCGNQFIPIIFLTSLTEVDSLASCLEAGGDDFLSKPYNRVILEAKLKAFKRMSAMHKTLQKQNDEITLHNERLLREQVIAKTIFDKVAYGEYLNSDNIEYSLSPLAAFNGDILLAANQPAGNLLVILGDFTGHGLAAAIGALPLAQTFYGMAEKGFSLGEILKELNSKLLEVLPNDLFCCACAVSLNFSHKTIEVWNGGLPDCYLYHKVDGSIDAIHSQHLPLGVAKPSDFNSRTLMYEMHNDDSVFLWSDGIVEAMNNKGEMYGESRLKQCFAEGADSKNIFTNIVEGVNAFVGEEGKNDDVSLVSVKMVDQQYAKNNSNDLVKQKLQGPMDWEFAYTMRIDTIRDFNPLPLLLHILSEVPGLRSNSGSVYTILAELYSNALEHGLLRLHSENKESAEGFFNYYDERNNKLQHLIVGTITFDIKYKGDDQSGVLSVKVIDSGIGFLDGSGTDNEGQENSHQYFGRGLSLLRSICKKVEVLGAGNATRVEYHWSYNS